MREGLGDTFLPGPESLQGATPGEGIAVLDDSGTILAASETLERMFRYEPGELVGLTLCRIIAGGAPCRFEHLRTPPEECAARSSTAGRWLRVVGVRKDGSGIPFDMTAVHVPEGREVGYVVVIRDCGSREGTEALLRLQSTALDAAANAIVITDPRGSILWVNPAFTRLTGYSSKEALGRNPRILKSGAHPDDFFAGLWKTVTTGIVWKGQTINRKKDGTLYVEDQTITPVRNPEGEMTHFIAIKNDITAQRRAEEALKIREEQYRLVVENVREIIFRCDTEGRWAFLNHAWTELLGYPLEESLGRSFLEFVDPEDHLLGVEIFRLLQSAEKAMVRRDIRGITRNGETRWFEVVAVRMEGLDGTFVGTSGTIADITRRKEVERLKSDFVSTVSHELRTPLTSIRGSLGLLGGGIGGVLSPQAQDLLAIAQRNCERLGLLIDDLLDMEKIESGKMVFSIRVVELLPLVEQVIRGASAYAGQFGVVLRITAAVQGARVKADPGRLTQVLTNLLSNAAKFSPQNSTVDVSMERLEGKIRVAVRDYGPGVPEEFRPRIFEKFAQADGSEARKKGGTGLGLSISRAIVERLGGRLDFESRVGEGTAFYFELPELEEGHGPEIP